MIIILKLSLTRNTSIFGSSKDISSHYRLSDTPSSTSSGASKKDAVRPKRAGLSEESKVAADAALTRLQQKRENPKFNTSLAAIQVSFLNSMYVHTIYCHIVVENADD